jgi:hypothetical protein
MTEKLRIAVMRGHKGSDNPLKTWVMLGSEPDEEPEFGTWLSPKAARSLAKRLMKAADKAEGKSL